jgi:hypothetical protein
MGEGRDLGGEFKNLDTGLRWYDVRGFPWTDSFNLGISNYLKCLNKKSPKERE